MAVLSRDDFFASLNSRVGSDTSDEAITFVENMTDTYNDLENRAKGDGTNWEQKYHELDESWKKRYTHRFFSGGDTNMPSNCADEANDGINPENITINDLFKKKGSK